MKNKKKYIGLTIKEAVLNPENKLVLLFDNGKEIHIYDHLMICCERRYMSTDDDINFLVGKKLVNIVTKCAVSVEKGSFDYHDVKFLEIMTDQGCITFANYNEHNGYYGGFVLTIEEVK